MRGIRPSRKSILLSYTSDFKRTFQVKVRLFILVFPTNPLCGLDLFAYAIFINTTQSINCYMSLN